MTIFVLWCKSWCQRWPWVCAALSNRHAIWVAFPGVFGKWAVLTLCMSIWITKPLFVFSNIGVDANVGLGCVQDCNDLWSFLTWDKAVTKVCICSMLLWTSYGNEIKWRCDHEVIVNCGWLSCYSSQGFWIIMKKAGVWTWLVILELDNFDVEAQSLIIFVQFLSHHLLFLLFKPKMAQYENLRRDLGISRVFFR